MNTDPVLRIDGVRFGYTPDETLIDIDSLVVARGESLFLRGSSGSGKSTLLGLIGGVMSPRDGRIELCGHDLTRSSSGQRDALRAAHLGIIFQQFNLLPYLSVLANIALPCRFSSLRASRLPDGVSAMQEATRLSGALGLEARDLNRSVCDLSVGQQQRVAVARALIGQPDLIIADEPTSALDHANRDRFIEVLNAQRTVSGASLLFVSHDTTLAGHFDRTIDMADLTASVPA